MTVSQDHRIIAMWSGPRNVSTALMYSFAQRQDCAVWDEPYYAAWLAKTGQNHPMRNAVLGAGPVAATDVAARVLERPTDAASVHYQKHMAHHMLPAFDLDNWFNHATHAFLIREPAPVLASYTQKFEDVSLDLLGYPQLAALFDRAADALGHAPPVIRGSDIQQAPELSLVMLTDALDLAFDPAMLNWPAGPKPYDGVWAPHWYDRVWATSRFDGPAKSATPYLPAHLARIADQAQPLYQRLAAHALSIAR
jgi:hypothetical protein